MKRLEPKGCADAEENEADSQLLQGPERSLHRRAQQQASRTALGVDPAKPELGAEQEADQQVDGDPGDSETRGRPPEPQAQQQSQGE